MIDAPMGQSLTRPPERPDIRDHLDSQLQVIPAGRRIAPD
jgi:hypothetical protein